MEAWREVAEGDVGYFEEFGLSPLAQGWILNGDIGFLGVKLTGVGLGVEIQTEGIVDMTVAKEWLEARGCWQHDGDWVRDTAKPAISRDLVRVWDYHDGLLRGCQRCFRQSWMLYVNALSNFPEEQEVFR